MATKCKKVRECVAGWILKVIKNHDGDELGTFNSDVTIALIMFQFQLETQRP